MSMRARATVQTKVDAARKQMLGGNNLSQKTMQEMAPYLTVDAEKGQRHRYSAALRFACEQCEMVLKPVPAPSGKGQIDLLSSPFRDDETKKRAGRVARSWEITERRAF